MKTLTHKFVDCIPEVLEDAVLYVSVMYGTAVHRCCCGCGREVVTPLTPTDWKLIFDGESVSLHPSIGNWNFPCRSHYWIRHNRVEWAEDWPEWKVNASAARDEREKAAFYSTQADDDFQTSLRSKVQESFWSRLWKRL